MRVCQLLEDRPIEIDDLGLAHGHDFVSPVLPGKRLSEQRFVLPQVGRGQNTAVTVGGGLDRLGDGAADDGLRPAVAVGSQGRMGTDAGDELEIDLDKGTILNKTKNTTFIAAPFPEIMQKIINQGGMVNYVRNRLAGSK